MDIAQEHKWHIIFRNQTEREVFDAIDKVITDMGYSIVRVRASDGQVPEVELMLAKLDDTPVTIGDCDTVTRFIRVILEALEVIPRDAMLSVSSPGIERPLTSETDLCKYVGQEVTVNLLRPIAGTRNWSGLLGLIHGPKDQVAEITIQRISPKGGQGIIQNISLNNIDMVCLKPNYRELFAKNRR